MVLRCLSVMSLTEPAPLNCSARIEGWNSKKLAVIAREIALNILSPYFEVEQVADVESAARMSHLRN